LRRIRAGVLLGLSFKAGSRDRQTNGILEARAKQPARGWRMEAAGGWSDTPPPAPFPRLRRSSGTRTGSYTSLCTSSSWKLLDSSYEGSSSLNPDHKLLVTISGMRQPSSSTVNANPRSRTFSLSQLKAMLSGSRSMILLKNR